jgi:hypothetical protein
MDMTNLNADETANLRCRIKDLEDAFDWSCAPALPNTWVIDAQAKKLTWLLLAGNELLESPFPAVRVSLVELFG